MPRQATVFGDVYIDLNYAVVVDAGVTNAGRERRFSVPIGREMPLAATLMAQVITLTPSGLGLSAPVPLVMYTWE